MAEINTVIAEASQDLQTIEDFVNLPAGSDVRPRLLPSVNVGTLAGARQAIFEAGGLPATPFETFANMETDGASLPDGQLAMVYNETANNGLYVKDGGVWAKSKYTPLIVGSDSTQKYIYHTLIRDIIGSDNLYSSGYNLYNDDNLMPTKGYINSNGDFVEQSTSIVTDFIEVLPSSKYTLSQSSTVNDASYLSGVIFYNENREFISRVQTENLKTDGYTTITTPANCYYVKLNGRVQDDAIVERMFYKGSDIKPYQKYQSKLVLPRAIHPDFYKPESLSVQLDMYSAAYKDYFNDLLKDRFTSSEILESNYNLYDDNAPKLEGLYYDLALNTVADPASFVSDFIRVEASTNYTLSQGSKDKSFIHSVVYYDSDKEALSRSEYFSVDLREQGYYTVTTPDNAYYMRLNCSIGSDDIAKRMVYEGAEVKPYQKYSAVNKIKKEYLPDDLVSDNTEQLPNMLFTGDAYEPVLLDFEDSYSKDDARKISDTGQAITYQDMTTWWGDLADEFPEYITKELVGYDSSGQYEVHSYKFSPTKVRGEDTTNTDDVRPRVMVIAFHIEHMNQLYPHIAMRELCRKWKEQPALAALRNEVEFMIMPYVHPWGFGRDYRLTSEGLNTNGDFPFLWKKVSGIVPNGDAPFATQEMRNVKKVAEKFKPHVFLDCHSNYANAETGHNCWMEVTQNPRYKATAISAVTRTVSVLSSVDPDIPDFDMLMRLTKGSGANLAGGYAYMLGCTGGLLEVAKNYKARPDGDGIYNDGLVFGTSLFLNLIIRCIAEYRDYGNPFDADKFGTYDEILAEHGLSRDE